MTLKEAYDQGAKDIQKEFGRIPLCEISILRWMNLTRGEVSKIKGYDPPKEENIINQESRDAFTDHGGKI